MINILSIAGFDPSSGAGITRDADTFFSLGFHGISVPTCTVVQNPCGVKSLYPSPKELFRETLGSVTMGMKIGGLKVGALCNEFYVNETARFLRHHKNIPVVVDPVFTAKNGVELVSRCGRDACISSLFRVATIVTPNSDEASHITGKRVRSILAAKRAAETIFQMGPKAVVVKGGHLEGDPVDVLYDGQEFVLYEKKRIPQSIHGTGCSFSSALTSFLARGYAIPEAFSASERYLEEFLRSSYRIDKNGYYYLSSATVTAQAAERWAVVKELCQAMERLSLLNPVELIPEVQMNIAYALPGAKTPEDVAAFPGRIGRHAGEVLFRSGPRFGASSKVSRIIIAYMRHYPEVRSAANVRCIEPILRNASARKLAVEFFDRTKESIKIKGAEGGNLDFLVDSVLKKAKKAPDIIYDGGAIGKEPILRLFARNPLELVQKMEMIRP